MYTESFACGTKRLMRGLMFESIRNTYFIIHWNLKDTIIGDD
jgi:hypothetical protein